MKFKQISKIILSLFILFGCVDNTQKYNWTIDEDEYVYLEKILENSKSNIAIITRS